MNTSASSNSNRTAAPKLNDNDLTIDVPLNGGIGETAARYEAGGVIWGAPQTVTSVDFVNGTWLSSYDGGFSSSVSLQYTTDGSIWSNSGWIIAPSYAYNSSAVSGSTYTFIGTPLSVLGVRVSGQVRTTSSSSYWDNMREVRAYASPVVSPTPTPAPTPTPTPSPSPVPAPTLSFSSNVTSILSGGSVILSWSSTNATSCTGGTGWVGTKPVSGSQTILSITATATFTLVCAGQGGSTTKAVSVGITPPAPTPTPTPTPTPSASTLNYKYGISMGDDLPGMSDAKLTSTLDDFKALGIGWVRLDLAWTDIQHDSSTVYNWTQFDKIVAAANARNIKLLPILAYTPSWARKSGCNGTINCAPQSNAQFAAFAGIAAKRYAPLGVHYWEIWNEPNLGDFWLPSNSAALYVDLLKQTSVAIKAQDSSAFIITGGLGPAATDGYNVSPRDFLIQMYANGAKGYFDAVGDHPYSFPVSPTSTNEDWNAWAQMSVTTVSIRSIMVANGDSAKQIWMTEFGAPTGGPGAIADIGNLNLSQSPNHVTEALQAAIMTDAANSAKQFSWAGPLIWYSYIDQSTDPSSNEHFFGILHSDGSKKPTYNLLKTITAQ